MKKFLMVFMCLTTSVMLLLFYLIYQNSIFDYRTMTIQQMQFSDNFPMQQVYLLKINKKTGIIEDETLLWDDWANIRKNINSNKKKKRVKLANGKKVDFPHDWDNEKIKNYIIKNYGEDAIKKTEK